MISNRSRYMTQASSEHAGRPRAVAAVMLLASLGPMLLLAFGVIESRSNPWAAYTIWFAAAGMVAISLPLIAIAVGILRRSVTARWAGVAVCALGGLSALALIVMINAAAGVPEGDASFFSLWLAIGAAVCAFMVWALATAPQYFGPPARAGQ